MRLLVSRSRSLTMVLACPRAETDSEDEKPAVKPVFKPKMPAAESEASGRV